MSVMTTFTGRHIDPVDPDPDLFSLDDIAHALSLLCRGNGHVKTFYSVGQHCVACAREAEGRGHSARVILACLLHDACECYLSDVPRPFKAVLPAYREAEERMLPMLYTHFLGSDLTEEEKRIVKQIDDDELWFDLVYLLDEDPGCPEPEMKAPSSRDPEPFAQTENQYREIYKTYIIKI